VSAGGVIGHRRKLPDDANASVLEFVVLGFDIDHEIFDDLARENHGSRADSVERHLLGRACLEPGRAGQDLRSGI
jgi:hypothetical protein